MSRTDTFAARLKAARDRAGLTQAALAEKAGLPAMTVSQLEQGRRADPKLSTLKALATALGVSLDELAG